MTIDIGEGEGEADMESTEHDDNSHAESTRDESTHDGGTKDDSNTDARDNATVPADEGAADESTKGGPGKRTQSRRAATKPDRAPRSFRIGATTLVLGALVVVLAVAVGVLSYVVTDRGGTIDTMRSDAADTVHAEKVALDYATGAAQMDYNDLAAWNKRLTAGTSKELATKLTDAATAMEQVIVPLQWKSTSAPVSAKVKSQDGDIFVVAAFVSVNTKNAQAPDGVQSTASYTVTVDRSRKWLITDVGGVDAAVK
ncbi:hypothetical protein GII33_14980 [Gordonia pseudamarae]|uniref:Mce-associated membrane protein n=1 Tax=Gordonia pseudamarae TaxID=2831662 RepID=A0ABX6IJ79_9ACTN|nr:MULTISPECIES: hypothetical protein [Gordonia]MBD0023235.1 hypothetical protein [Gordonia sp. (in: high G+C Gram-positive bacteria)]QHN27058.1 hypothetical protein GII33_14980 [Gordonia pseudamarae]QHN35947.1 hypothetical protein GII31_14805 [Gordonia pseudamarae]